MSTPIESSEKRPWIPNSLRIRIQRLDALTAAQEDLNEKRVDEIRLAARSLHLACFAHLASFETVGGQLATASKMEAVQRTRVSMQSASDILPAESKERTFVAKLLEELASEGGMQG